MRYRFGRRRGGPASLGAVLVGLVCVSGWSWVQGRRFVSACKSIVSGQTLADAEATLVQRKGVRPTWGQPVPNTSVYVFKTFGAGTRTCEIAHEEGAVVSATAK